MAFMLSAGVNVSEIDATGIIPAVSTSVGAFTGAFNWGPINTRVFVTSETDIVNIFTKPDSNTATYFFTAADFLSYSNSLYMVRAGATALRNSNALGNTTLYITNEDSYEGTFKNGSANVFGPFAARYASTLGNSLRISLCPGDASFNSALSGVTANIASGNSYVVLTGANAQTTFVTGDFIKVGTGSFVTITNILSANTIVTDTNAAATLVANTVSRKWQYADQFSSAPGTSVSVSNKLGANDEMHIIVIDEDGLFTGVKNTILEKFEFVSKALDARNQDGSGNYYKEVLQSRSRYIYWMDHLTSGSNWGSPAATTTFTAPTQPYTVSLTGGVLDTPTDANIITGYDLFSGQDDVDISLLIGGPASATVATYLINNIAEVRKDCVAVISPPASTVVNNLGRESDSTIAFRNQLPSSSYAFLDSGWKYRFDKYNNVYRYTPLNGDVAGCMAYTDSVRDPWYSPAGFSRGNIKNVYKLAWNPAKQAVRDNIYKIGINPVVSFPGQGTVLYGDKTLLSKPSAFDRINVRRLFIILEKAIATASKFALFEFNDEFTRAQFVNLVEPFLREVKGRRGIYDYRVVCDESNNTQQVIDSNQFVGDIYIKPARSINFIQLNFVAVQTGVAFEEIVGKFG